MKRVFAFVMFFFAVATFGMAQQGKYLVSGRVLDPSGSALPFATISVLNADSVLVSGAVSQEDGTFAVSLKAKGDYIARFTFVGYKTLYRNIAVSDAAYDMGMVSLQPDAMMLDGVTITAKAPIVEQQFDKLVVNVAQSAFAQGSTAEDLLRKSPGVTIDKDGNVQLNGNAVSVWIDGRPTQLDGRGLEALLRATDGATIDKIELMANPSAKYDAAGQGGIINIKTRKSILQGLNGSLSMNYGGMAFGRPTPTLPSEPAQDNQTQYLQEQSVALNLNYRTEKTNSFLLLSESTNGVGVDYSSRTHSTMNAQDFLQQSESRFLVDQKSFNLKLGNDWFIDNNNTLGFIFSMPIFGMNQQADTNCNITYQMLNNSYQQLALTNAVTRYDMRQYSGNLNYTHVFNPALANELTVNIDYFRNYATPMNLQDNYIASVAPWTTFIPTKLSINTDNVVDVYSAKVDWQRVVLGAFMMEAGGKWATTMTGNDLTQELQPLGMPLATSHNIFDYTEHIGAVYATLAGQLSPVFSAKIGLRGEGTISQGDWYSADTVTKRSYFDLFPTLFVGYTPKPTMRFSLVFSRRIQRPTYSLLNPFRNYVDAHTYNMGNPNLKPAYSNSLVLNAGFGQYVNLSLEYVRNTDVLSPVPHIDLATGDQDITISNFGRNDILGGSFTLSELPLFSQLFLTLSLGAHDFASYEAHKQSLVLGVASDGSAYEQHSFLANAYSAITFTPTPEWKIQVDGYAVSPIVSGYLRTKTQYVFNLAVKKSMLENRLLFTLAVNDLFRSSNADFETVGEDLVQSAIYQRYCVQKVTVGLQWNFGTAQKPLKHRKVGDIDEVQRVSHGDVQNGVQGNR